MNKGDRLYLVLISECIARIEQYTAGGHEAFLRDTMIQDAVLRNLHILSESTQRLSSTLKDRQTSVDWRLIAVFRNVVVHDYMGIDNEQVWDIIENDLPDLKRKVAAILTELSA